MRGTWACCQSLYPWPAIDQTDVQKELQPYWSFQYVIPIIVGTAMRRGRRITAVFQDKALKLLHPNQVGIDMTCLLAPASIYSINMNADLEEAVKNFPTCFDTQATKMKDKTVSYKVPGRTSESVRADIFTFNKKHYLSIVDNHHKRLVVKLVEGFSSDTLIKTCNTIF